MDAGLAPHPAAKLRGWRGGIDENIRREYLKNHKIWFLRYHPNAYDKFSKEVEEKYGIKLLNTENEIKELTLFNST